MSESGERSAGGPLHIEALSPREREILDAALSGLSARQLASRFFLTEATVRSHLAHIYRKLEVRGRVDLLARVAESAPPATHALPHQRLRRGRQLFLVAAAVLLVACGGVALRLTLADGGTTDLASVARLVSDHRVSALDLASSTLTVTTMDGMRMHVNGVSMRDFAALRAAIDPAADPSVSLAAHNSGPAALQLAAVGASAIAPAVLAALALLASAAIVILLLPARRRPR